ncbi:MAG: SDR family oxidoreductase [Myxococcales bacterium]|nr:SDR family oxidoreductase [Myxococcales bacterium]
MRPASFRGKVAIVTGGASGIGAALGRELAARGAEVVLVDRQLARAEDVAATIRASGGRATAGELDVRDFAANQRVVRDVVERAGRVDLFVANAGIAVGGEIDTYDASDWDDVFDVNLRGVAYGLQAVYPQMIEQRAGHFVATASMAGLVSAAGEASYTASKHAVVGLMKTLRVEGARHGVRASVLCPGAIETPILTGGEYGRFKYAGLSKEAARALWDRVHPMDVDVFARKALDAIARGEAIIVLPAWWKALWYLERASPAAGVALWRRLLTQVRADIAKAGGRPL